MNTNMLSRFPTRLRFVAIVCFFALMTSFTAQAAEAVSDKSSVRIADPRGYDATPDEKLGINENGKGLDAGAQIENIALKDVHGADYNLSEAWSKGPALIVFYRGGWCPYCNTHVRELAVRYDDFVKAGVQPILISVDTPDKTAMVGAKYEIPFPVLSDPELIAHSAFNVVMQLDAQTVEKYKGLGLDLSQWSGKNHNAIAVASAFIIDQSGTVVMSHAPEDYTQRPSADQLLAIIGKVIDK